MFSLCDLGVAAPKPLFARSVRGARNCPRLPPDAAFSGLTAAWLHGIDVTPDDPIEATAPKHAGVSGRAGMMLRRSDLRNDVVTVRGIRTLSVARMLADLCGRLSLTEAVVVADAALHSGRIRIQELAAWADAKPRRHGIRALRRVIALADPATESPMETRLRMVLVLAGLPRPKAQVPIHDSYGRFAGRPDLYYEAARLAIEYDGDVHRRALVEDNRRQNKLLAVRVRLLLFTAADVLGNPDSVVAQVRHALVPPQNQFGRHRVRKVPALLLKSGLPGSSAPAGAIR